MERLCERILVWILFSWCVFNCNADIPSVNITASIYTKVYGESVTIPCTITASPSLQSSSWSFTASGGSTSVTISNNGKYTIATDINNPDLTISNLVFSNAGVYTCQGMNAEGSGNDTATLDITGAVPSVDFVASTYTKVYGESVTIPCTITASPSLQSSSWLFTAGDGSTPVTINNNEKYTIATDINNPNLTINNLVFSNAGVYTCQGTNAVGSGSDTGILSITGAIPSVNITASTYTKVYGESVTIPCTITASPSLQSSSWSFTASGGSTSVKISNNGKYTIAPDVTSPNLTINNLVFNNAGVYTCQGMNAVGLSSDSATLNINGGTPTVTVTSNTYTRNIGQNVTFSCMVSSVPALSSQQWSFKSNSGSTEVNISQNTGRYLVNNSQIKMELTVTGIVHTDAGHYECTVVNLVGSSSKTILLATEGGQLTVSVTEPSAQNKIGTDITLGCTVTGKPNATQIKWKRSNVDLNISDQTKYGGGSVSTPSLTIKNLAQTDKGTYQCLAINFAGTGSSNTVSLNVIDLQFGDACSPSLICDDSKHLECVSGTCQCKSSHYPYNQLCYEKKKLNENCDVVMLCVNDSHVSCISGRCSCNTGYYDDNGSTVGGTCQSRKLLGEFCNSSVQCLEDIICATDKKCRCPDGTYYNNKSSIVGSCQNMTDLKVVTFSITANTSSITVTWTPPTKLDLISRYDIKWKVAEPSSDYNTKQAGTATSIILAQGLISGQVYDIIIVSVDTYTQVNEQSISSDTRPVRLKPQSPGAITNPSSLDAPTITLMWTPPIGIVSTYRIEVMNTSFTQSTTNDTPKLVFSNANLVPGTYYNISITAISGDNNAAGGKTESDPYVERIRTMIETPGRPTNVQCPSEPKDRSLLISWSAPSSPNGFIQYYIIKVYVKGTQIGDKNTSTPTAVSYDVLNLYPETFYQLEVITVNDGSNDINRSPPSTRITCQTTAALATPPLNPSVSEIKSRSFNMSFSRPAQPNGVLRGYRMYVYQASSCYQEILFKCSDCPTSVTTPSYSNKICSGYKKTIDISNVTFIPSIAYQVTELLPYIEYKIEVVGINGIGVGNYATIPTVETEQEAPNKPESLSGTDIGTNSIKLGWNIVGPRPGPTNITLSVYEVINGTDNLLTNSVVHLESAFNTREYTFKGLEEFWEYKFQVKAATVIGQEMSDMSAIIKTKPTAPGNVSDFAVQKSDPSTFTLVVVTWKIPSIRERNSYLIKYILDQNFTVATNNGQQEIDVIYDDNMITRNFPVTPETCYTVQVYAMSNETTNNKGGVSVIDYCAPPGPPPEPSTDVIITKTGGESATTTSFVVEIDLDFFNDETNGKIEFFGIAICKTGNCKINLNQGAKASEWRNLPNFQTAKERGYPLYRATGEKYIATVRQKLNRGRRRRAISSQFSVGTEDCSTHNSTSYCNGPLPADTSFSVVLFVCTKGGCTHTDPFGPYKTEAEPTPVWIFIVAAVGGLLVAGIVVAVIFVIRRRKRNATTSKYVQEQNEAEDEEEDAELKNIPRKRPFKLKEIESVVAMKHKDSNLMFAREYEDLKRVSPQHSSATSDLDANRLKNRYVNILPYDHSRVKLLPIDDEPASDFINANYLPGYKSEREYIGAQGPIPGTVDDFWRMIWEQNVGIVIMLTLCKEDGRVKCEPYWPMELREIKQYGEIIVETVNLSTVNTYDFRIFNLRLGDNNRSLKHFHFLQWKDFSANVQNDTMIEFIKNVRSHIQPPDMNGPVVVHCSAGVGRTGTFIALDHMIQYIDNNINNLDKSIDIFDLVLTLRQNRTLMVQTEQQYVFIHDVLKDYLERRRKEENGELLYENVNRAFEPDPDEGMYANWSQNQKTDL